MTCRRKTRTRLYRIDDGHGGRLPALLESICDEPDPSDPSMGRNARVAAVLGLAFGASGVVAEHHDRYDALDSHVTVALSALTTITELQHKG